MLMGYQIMI
nr:unnamed protein product [Callosobruchus chinensis]